MLENSTFISNIDFLPILKSLDREKYTLILSGRIGKWV
jgi:hypothetical protein